MTEATSAPLLDLDTLVERPCITIDGVRFAIRSPSELSVVESHRFGRWGQQIDALSGNDAEAARDELDALVAKVCKAILIDVPDEVFEKLSGANRWALIDLFIALLLREKLKVAGAMMTAAGPVPASLSPASLIGASSFPGSSGSTAARPTNGFTAFLRLLSGRT